MLNGGSVAALLSQVVKVEAKADPKSFDLLEAVVLRSVKSLLGARHSAALFQGARKGGVGQL